MLRRAVVVACIWMGVMVALGIQPASVLGVLALSLTTIPLAILFHEGGHWAAGWALGHRCLKFVVGPLELTRVASGWRARFQDKWRTGAVYAYPSSFEQFRLQMGISAVAGPMGSFVGAVVFLWFGHVAEDPSFAWFWFFAAAWSAVLGVENLRPFQWGGHQSDGYSLLEFLLQRQEGIDAIQRRMLAGSSQVTDLRPRDWPRDLILRLAEAVPDGHLLHHKDRSRQDNLYCAYLHFLDSGDMVKARLYLDRLLAGWRADDPPEHALEAAYFLAYHGGDAAGSRKWLEMEARNAEPWLRGRAAAAVEQAGGNRDKARELIMAALAALRAARPCGAQQYEMDLLGEMLQRPAALVKSPA